MKPPSPARASLSSRRSIGDAANGSGPGSKRNQSSRASTGFARRVQAAPEIATTQAATQATKPATVARPRARGRAPNGVIPWAPAMSFASRSVALVKGLRPKQWIKNLLVFAGFIFTLNERWRPGSALMWSFLERAACGFVLFSFVSSSIYLLNDIRDVEKDRLHVTKKNRPIASGALPPGLALAAAVLLMPVCLLLAFRLSPAFAGILLAYIIMQFGYIFALKDVVLLDVFILALGFVMRAISGAVVIGVTISPWLYTVTLLGALFLGLCKRRSELVLLDQDAASHRKILAKYTPSLLDSLISIVA